MFFYIMFIVLHMHTLRIWFFFSSSVFVPIIHAECITHSQWSSHCPYLPSSSEFTTHTWNQRTKKISLNMSNKASVEISTNRFGYFVTVSWNKRTYSMQYCGEKCFTQEWLHYFCRHMHGHCTDLLACLFYLHV